MAFTAWSDDFADNGKCHDALKRRSGISGAAA
jgi:hypothetical protein